MNKEIKGGLQDVDHMPKVMVRHKVVVSGSACNQEAVKLICTRLC